ncbi:MAG: hypothetical protein WCT47_20880 [Betaproteobacteria bacterium]|jgi:hypothetical protein
MRCEHVLGWVGGGAGVSTGVVLLAVQYESTWGCVVVLPLYACFLFMMLAN